MITHRTHDVVITSKRCHCDVITSKWRHFDVITTPLLPNVSVGIGTRVYELISQRKDNVGFTLRAVSIWSFTFTISSYPGQSSLCSGLVRACLNCQYDCHCNVKGPGHQQLWLEYYDFIDIWRLMQVPITYAWVVYVQKPGTCTLKHCHKYMWNKKHWGERRPRI